MKVFVVILNWNGGEETVSCLHELTKQTLKHEVVLVDNGSEDNSIALVEAKFPKLKIIKLNHNTGFAGGVNVGITYAFDNEANAVALLNNDAVAERDWLENLVSSLEDNPEVGIATCKFIRDDKKHFDSTGDIYTTWGLPYPRGRDEPVSDTYDKDTMIFGASGGASVYKVSMLKEIGLFDEDLFAYLEDIDISFRAQLAGWKVMYNPKAVAYHKVGMTSGKIKGFTTYHYMKNLPIVFWKNVPLRYFPRVAPRLFLSYWTILFKALITGKGSYALKGYFYHITHLPSTLRKRRRIQRSKKVSNDYVWSILTHDLPPNAKNLRRLRSLFTNDS